MDATSCSSRINLFCNCAEKPAVVQVLVLICTVGQQLVVLVVSSLKPVVQENLHILVVLPSSAWAQTSFFLFGRKCMAGGDFSTNTYQAIGLGTNGPTALVLAMCS